MDIGRWIIERKTRNFVKYQLLKVSLFHMQFSQIHKREEKRKLKNPLWSFHENVQPELRLRCT